MGADALLMAFERGGDAGRRMRENDWSATPLGPPADWPGALAGAVTVLLASGTPMVIWWGPARVALHNDAAAGLHVALPASIERVHATDRPVRVTGVAAGPDVFVDAVLDPIRLADGTVGGVLAVLTDVTGRMLAERRADELTALDQARTDVLVDVSHEFRTPLTLILGPLDELLTDPGLSAADRDRLLPMRRNGLRLLKLVNTVLDYARMESGRVRAAYRPTDLAAHTAGLAGTFRSAAERAGLTLVVDAPPLPEPVYVDREMWEKIVLNLLSNAVKFTREGRIEVRVRADGDAAVLAVHDTGIGFDRDERPLLFDRFHRVTGAWSRSREGTGIGLALVRELAELHGGSVDAVSDPAHGSTFSVRVPFGTAHLPADRIAPAGDPAAPLDVRPWTEETGHPWDDDVPAAPGVAHAETGHILLVDDNADLRDYVTRLLRSQWQVTTAADGQQALDLIAEHEFDLVLTDVMMPRLDGFGLIAALRANERTAQIPIVVLSARAGEDESAAGLALGADDYLVKPFSARDLIARVRGNVELSQARRQTISRLRGLVDTAAAVSTVRTTAEVLHVAARHVLAMTGAGRVVVTTPGARAEADGGAPPGAEPVSVLPLPDTSGVTVGELKVWAGAGGPAEPAVLLQLARLIGLRLENARLYEAEHRIASTLQHSLLPQSLPRVPGAIVATRYLPGSSEAEVGGDWYDVIETAGEQLYLVIGDVVGKGVQAAAGMGQLRNALRAYILEGFDCGAALSRLNRLVDNLGRRQFATVVCARFDPRTRSLHYASAGHLPPIVVEPGRTGSFLYSAALGPPIGALGEFTYPTRETELGPGSRLLLFTDGLVEDRRTGIDTGLDQLTADVAKPADHVEDLLDRLLEPVAARPRRDDVAMIALQVTEPREFRLRLPADPARLSVLRRRLEDFLTGNGVPEADIFDLTIAVSEAAANAIEHPIAPAEPVIVVEASIDDEAVTITVRDTGRWKPSTGPGFRGRGLALIGALSELSVARTGEGTAVTLRRPLPER